MTLVFTGSIGMEEVSPSRVKGVRCWRQSAVLYIMHASKLKVNKTTLDQIAPTNSQRYLLCNVQPLLKSLRKAKFLIIKYS